MINDTPGLKAAEFAKFQKLIYEIAGISMPDTKQVLMVGRLGRRLRHYGLNSFSAYYDLITSKGQAEELQIMVELLTTNETYFFREPKHFEFLAHQIAVKHPPGTPLEIWSAASSTGEEIYTIAMVLADTLGLQANWRVTGTDINRAVLATAERGLYWLDRTRGLSMDYLRKYCLKGVRENEGGFLIIPELRRHTRFLQVNLNQQLPNLGKFHAIFLRNVMIYFDNDTKKQVVERLIQQLHPGGYLIIGHSESLHGITNAVKAVQPTIYQCV
ncbi:Methylase of chemotaxis methyl-accepting protein [gamma proteobacterium HdN1]|nr:Methylase of chemotaxis methyl-accepting protein [gamma proteobacterium HdN1]